VIKKEEQLRDVHGGATAAAPPPPWRWRRGSGGFLNKVLGSSIA